MFNIPSFFGFRASGGYDLDALAFFVRVNIATGTVSGDFLTTTEKYAVNQLVLDMKADSIYSKMKAVYPMVGGGTGTLAQREAACKQNLISASFTGTFTAGWTFASTGVTPNGTSAYMDTNLNSDTSLNLNDVHVSVYLRTDSDSAYCDLGNFDGVTSISIFARYLNRQFARMNDFLPFATDDTIPTTDSRGFRLGNRSSSSVKSIYINNSGTNFTRNSIGKVNANLFIAGRGPAFFSNRENAFTSIGDGLSTFEESEFYTAVQAFQTTLSRQITT